MERPLSCPERAQSVAKADAEKPIYVTAGGVCDCHMRGQGRWGILAGALDSVMSSSLNSGSVINCFLVYKLGLKTPIHTGPLWTITYFLSTEHLLCGCWG